MSTLQAGLRRVCHDKQRCLEPHQQVASGADWRHRARRLLRAALSERLASSVAEAFMFMGARCERMSERALATLPNAS